MAMTLKSTTNALPTTSMPGGDSMSLPCERGFLPVVALDPNATSTNSQLPVNPKGKGKSKKGRVKGKGGGQINAKYSKAPIKPHDPRGRAQAALRCLRCGSTSHTTTQCIQGSKPTPKASPTGPNKKQVVEGVAATNIPESGMVIFEDHHGAARPDCAIMDPGASSILMGYGPFCRYVEYFRKLNFPVDKIIFKKAQRTFHFGGDHQALSTWTVHLPIFVNHQYGLVHTFLLKGETPMLLGRPISKALGMTVDFLNDRIKFNDGEWRDATLGRHSKYLLPLTENFDPEIIANDTSFDLVKKHVGKLIDLHVEGKAEALRVVQKLHRNLGHPSTKSLVELLQSRNASEAVIQVAGSYVCAACQRYHKPNQPAPSSIATVENFNQKVQSDVFWIKEGGKKYPILSNIDMATKYQTATLLHSEKTGDLISGFERSWIAHFGPPSKLLTDEGRGWVSDQMAEWTDSLSIDHEVAPGEAHTRLSLVERRHAVLIMKLLLVKPTQD
eukprot:s3688_g7.t1